MKGAGFVLLTLLLLLSCEEKEKRQNADVASEPLKEWLTFEGDTPAAKHIVLISGDEEYRSEEALPQLAKILSKRHGFRCTVLFAQDPSKPGIVNPNYLKNIPGLEYLSEADLMIIFTRFRALPDYQMKYIDDYLKSGKPVVGIRTATHAFNFEGSESTYGHYSNNYSGSKKDWTDGFGRLVLGEKWITHHGSHKNQSTRGIIAVSAREYPVTNGLSNGDVWGPTDVYGVRLPLPGDSKPIIMGQVMERQGEFSQKDIFYGMRPEDDVPVITNDTGVRLNDPMMPVAWTKSYELPGGQKGKAFVTTIGASNDLLIDGTRRLLVNGVYWALGLEVPQKANVGLIGDYQPTKFEFRDDDYWLQNILRVEDLQ